MEFGRYLAALKRTWIVAVVSILVLGGVGLAASFAIAKKYSSSVTFFISVGENYTGNNLTADQYVERRISSYADLLTSQRMGRAIKKTAGVDLSVSGITSRITTSHTTDTVLLGATVEDTSRSRSLAITKAIATDFPSVVRSVDPENASTATTLQIISGPTLASQPVSPDRTVLVGLGLLGGLAVGLILVFLVESLSRGVQSAADVELVVGPGRLHTVSSRRRTKDVQLIDSGSNDKAGLEFAESIRLLRTTVLFAHAHDDLSVLLVTSPNAREGKTSLACNLAISLAEIGKDVLLIDANLRKPQAGSVMVGSDEPGLTDVLTGQAGLESAVVKRPDGLSVLPAGTLSGNPSEILASQAMANFLLSARARFTMVIVDSPAVLPVADAAMLATLTDGVLITTRMRDTKMSELRDAVAQLESIEARIAGVVVVTRRLDSLDPYRLSTRQRAAAETSRARHKATRGGS